MSRKIVIFTDLDETLLERYTYSFEKARPALERIRDLGIPLVICTSKTKAEIDVYREKLDNNHPFISENGGGIFVPKGYFQHIDKYSPEEMDGYDIITLGTPYHKLRHVLHDLREHGFGVRGFGDMSPEEISSLTGLNDDEATRAKERNFDEAFIFNGNPVELRKEVREHGLHMTQGRLYHLLGENDKGKAIGLLQELYLLEKPETVFIALGDSPTDTPMLQRVDYPVLIQKDNGSYDGRVSATGLIKAKGIGPEGWNTAVLELLEQLS